MLSKCQGTSWRSDDWRRRSDPNSSNSTASNQTVGAEESGRRKIISLSRRTGVEVKLRQSDHPWKPFKKRQPAEAESAKTEELYRNVRGILNRLTPEKFSPLVMRLLGLEIDTEETLRRMVHIIFEAAIESPKYAVAFANMCKHLMLIKVPTSTEKGVFYFRKILLNRCQKEFEAGALLEKETDGGSMIQSSGDRAEGNHIETKKAAAKRRYLTNIRFIGELFKLKMLTEPIMHDCIGKLLGKEADNRPDCHDDESLECLCRLLTTIGKDLDHNKSLAKIDSYFREIIEIIRLKKTASSRVRFMLMDLVELRKTKWVSRRDDSVPGTILSVREEAERVYRETPLQERIDNEVRSLTDEFSVTQDRRRALYRVKKFCRGRKMMTTVVGNILTNVVAHSGPVRRLTGHLFDGLIENGTLSPDQVVEGSSFLFKNAVHFLVDIPHLWKYVAEIFAGLITEFRFSLRHFATLCELMTPARHVAAFAAATLKRAEKELGRSTLSKFWRSAELEMDVLLRDWGGDVDAFLDSHDLRYLVRTSGGSARTAATNHSGARNTEVVPRDDSSSSSNSFVSVSDSCSDPALSTVGTDSSTPAVSKSGSYGSLFSKELERRLRTEGDEETRDWIDARIDTGLIERSDVVKALMTGVLAMTVEGEGVNALFDRQVFKKHCRILRHFLFLDFEVSLEIQALYAAQNFVRRLRHPPSVLQELFDVCYHEDVISEAAFRAWKHNTSRSPNEEEGLALRSVVNFKWLDEADDEADDEFRDVTNGLDLTFKFNNDYSKKGSHVVKQESSLVALGGEREKDKLSKGSKSLDSVSNDLASALDKANDEICKLRKENSRLVLVSNEANEEVEKLKTENYRQVSVAAEELEKFKIENSRLISINAEAHLEVEKLVVENYVTIKEVDKLAQEKSEVIEEVEKLKGENLRAIEEVEKLKSEKLRTVEDFEKLKSENLRAMEEVEKLKSKNLQTLEEVKQLKSEKLQARNEGEALARINSVLVSKYGNLKSSNADVMRNLSDRDRELADLKEKYEALRVEKEEIDTMVDALESRFMSFVTANEKWRKKVKIIEDRLAE